MVHYSILSQKHVTHNFTVVNTALLALAYLNYLQQISVTVHSSHSNSTFLLSVVHVPTENGKQAFSVLAPIPWSQLQVLSQDVGSYFIGLFLGWFVKKMQRDSINQYQCL